MTSRVITASSGLIPPHTLITLERLREISAGNVDLADSRYTVPLERDDNISTNCLIVRLPDLTVIRAELRYDPWVRYPMGGLAGMCQGYFHNNLRKTVRTECGASNHALSVTR